MSIARPSVQSTSIPRCFKTMSFKTLLSGFLFVQNGIILLIMLLTSNGLLLSFEYEGIYTLFIIFPGPLSSFCAVEATWRILDAFPAISNGWVCIVLIPAVFNMIFGSFQTIALFFIFRRIWRWLRE